MSEAAFRRGSLLAQKARAAGVSVEVGAPAKLKRLMELANKSEARYALLIGDDELARGEFALKDMRSGEQVTVPEAELVGRLY